MNHIKNLFLLLKSTAFALILVLLAQPAYSQNDASSEDTPLMNSVKANNLKEVTRLVEAGAEIDGDAYFFHSPLDYALEHNFRPIAEYLLKNGAKSSSGLYDACKTNDLKWIQTLLDYGLKDSEAIIAAVENGHLEVVKLLVNKGYPVNVSQKRKPGLFRKYYVTPIELAIENRFDAIAIYLVDHGVSVEEAINQAMTVSRNELVKKLTDRGCDLNALFLNAIGQSNKEIASHALLKGADRFAKDKEGRTAVLIAIEKGEQTMIDYTINELKLDINGVTAKHENALMLAAKSSNLDLVSKLLDKTINLEFENNYGETALFYAARNENSAILELFLAKQINLKKVNNDGNNILLDAAFRGNFVKVSRLMDAGVDYMLTNKQGYNVLSYLVNQSDYSFDKKMAMTLLEKGLDVNSSGTSKESLVFKAVEMNDLIFLDYLRGKGANFDPKNSSGQRPDCKNPQIIKYLIENGADINGVDSWKNTYMCVALSNHDLELAAYLIAKKINLEQACYFDEPALIKAIKEEDLAFVKFLVENNADVNVIGYFKENAAQYAKKTGNQELIDYLKSKGAMTKEEHNAYILARMEDTKKLNGYLETNAVNEAVVLLNKFPDMVVSPDQLKKMGILSVTANSLELLQIVLERYRFDLNKSVNFQGQTLLMVASENGKFDLVKLLVNKGTDPKLEDSFGKTAVDYAKDKEIKTFLKEKMKTK